MAILLQALLAIGVVWIADLQEMLSYLGLTLSLSAALAVASLFVIHAREGRASISLPGYPLVPAAFVLATLTLAAIAATRRPAECLATLATIASGAVLYVVIRRAGRQE